MHDAFLSILHFSVGFLFGMVVQELRQSFSHLKH